MDKKITNKRVNLTDILHIAEIVDRHCKYYKDLEQAENRKKEEAKARDERYYAKYITSKVRYSIQFNNNETVTEEDNIGWFTETLLHNAKIISNVDIDFNATEEDKKEIESNSMYFKRESLSIRFYPNKINFDTSTSNMYDNPLANMIEQYINSLPARFDDVVFNDTRRKMIPALTISIPFGIIVSFVLLVLGRLDIISAGISKFLTTGIALTGIFLIIAFFGALLIPTKNTDLYRNIKFETYYAGYDDKNFKAIRKNDYAEYKSQCEVAIGQNVNMPAVRQNIEENYKKAKKVVKIELIVSIIAIILFFVF